MEPDDVVNLPLTRMEIARIHAALSALVSLHGMMGDKVPAGLALVDAVEVIQGVLPRMRAEFPEEIAEHTDAVFKVPGEAKTSTPAAGPFDVKVTDLVGLSPQESAAIFGTQYDQSIRDLLATLNEYTDYSDKEFQALLESHKQLLKQTVRYPKDLSVKDSGPYVELSDLITLGGLAHAMWERQDQIEDNTSKPF